MHGNNILKLDDRRGLGYGQLNPSGRDAPRGAQAAYPYHVYEPLEAIPEEEAEQVNMGLDKESQDAFITKIMGDVGVTDPLDFFGTDPFSFAGGNTKLIEALYGEIKTARPSGTSMVPFPKMYKGAVFSNDTSPLMHYGPTDGFGSTSQSYGTKHGYSKASKFSDEQREPIPVEDYADFFDTEKIDRDLVASVKRTTEKILGINAKAK